MEAHHSGMILYPFRPYAPSLQRFLQADPIGLAGGLNLHRFVRNNPVNRIDPLGLEDLLLLYGTEAEAQAAGEATRDMLQLFWHEFQDFFEEDYGTSPSGEPYIGGAPFFGGPAQKISKGFCKLTDWWKARRAAKKLPTFPKPPVPGGFKPAEISELLGFGSGKNVPGLERTFTKEFLQQNGITKEIATQWKEVYRWQVENMPGNPAAPGRLELMNRILKILE